MTNQINYAYIQSGYCVFGTGSTRAAAIEDAKKWLEDENGQQGGLTIEQVENLLETSPVDGSFQVIASDHSEFDSYLENQGAYVNRNGKWFEMIMSGPIAKIEIKMENDAFENPQQELARILHRLAEEIEYFGHTKSPIFDLNGNNVGQFIIED